MTPLLDIRLRVFRADQVEMAAIVGVNQGTWSRWERGLRHPTLHHLQRLRAEAARRGLNWHDRWFFERGGASA